MIADALAMQAAMASYAQAAQIARASASIVIISAEFSRIIPTSATDG